jgi:NAD(P)H-dependent FMN reductase
MIHAIPGRAIPRVLVVLGSTRQGRICPKVAAWVIDIGRGIVDATFETVDLRDWRLPMDDEPGVPAAGAYLNAHTLAWSRKVSESDAVVLVTPQYNWGYPAPLKNALDHLYSEWRGMPAVIVTYGQRGGGKCAKQLRQVADGLHMRTVGVMPALRLPRALIEANDGSVVPEQHFAGAAAQVRRAFGKLAGELKGRSRSAGRTEGVAAG